MIHVHMRNHDIGYRSQINTGCGQPFHQLPCPGQVKIGVEPQSRIDENSLVAATHHHYIQRPVERILGQEHIVQPFGP